MTLGLIFAVLGAIAIFGILISKFKRRKTLKMVGPSIGIGKEYLLEKKAEEIVLRRYNPEQQKKFREFSRLEREGKHIRLGKYLEDYLEFSKDVVKEVKKLKQQKPVV